MPYASRDNMVIIFSNRNLSEVVINGTYRKNNYIGISLKEGGFVSTNNQTSSGNIAVVSDKAKDKASLSEKIKFHD